MLAALVVHDDTINLAGIMVGNGLSRWALINFGLELAIEWGMRHAANNLPFSAIATTSTTTRWCTSGTITVLLEPRLGSVSWRNVVVDHKRIAISSRVPSILSCAGDCCLIVFQCAVVPCLYARFLLSFFAYFVVRLDVSSVQAKVYSEGINMYNILSPCAGGVSSGLRENLYHMAGGQWELWLAGPLPREQSQVWKSKS